jgi:putative transcriptional regulator
MASIMLQTYVVFVLHSIYAMDMGRLPKQEKDQVLNLVEGYRTSAGLSRSELAKAVDVHYQTIGYIERGEYAPTLALALRLAEVLGCSVEELFKLKGKSDE